jgi:hypothetical protein
MANHRWYLLRIPKLVAFPKLDICRIGTYHNNSVNVASGTRVACPRIRHIGNPVTEPPTNTTSSNKGRKSRAAFINCSRFESNTRASQSRVQLVFGDLAFPSAPVPQGVRQGEVLVKCRIPQCRKWRRLIQRREGHSSLLAVDARPDRDRITATRDQLAERFGGQRGCNPTSELAMFGGKCVAQAVDKKLLKRHQIRAMLHLGTVQQMASHRTPDANRE